MEKPWRFRNQFTTLPIEQRFWEKVDIRSNDECWPWIASVNRGGYGRFGIKLSNRVAWELVNGPIPDSLCVLHRCDNPPCCNPAHLFLGTLLDNNKDRKDKGRGRGAVGEKNHNAKLTSKDVIEIRRLYSTGKYSQHQLARLFNVSRVAIKLVVQNRTWR